MTKKSKYHNASLRRAGVAARILAVMLVICGSRAFVCAIADAARFFCKHYVLSIIILIAYGWMFVALANARMERDRYNATAVEYQMRNENLELMIKK